MIKLFALKYIVFTVALVVLGFSNGIAQSQISQDSLIQFSGIVLEDTSDERLPVPFVNVYVKEDTRRGVSTDFKGFFTFVVEKGETIIFSAIGYKEVEFVIPDTLSNRHHSIVQLMSQDTVNLPETVVFPWPSREHFKQDFLAMNVTSDLQRRASKNTALLQDILEEQKSEVAVARKTPGYYLRQQSNNYNRNGQLRKIIDPIAWNKFFQSLKAKVFKKKKEK